MPSYREQQLARARAIRRAQRASERARRRRLVAAVLVGVLIVAGGGVAIAVALSSGNSNSTVTAQPSVTASPNLTASASASASAAVKPVACGAPREKLATATRTFSREPAITIDKTAKYTMTLATSCGAISVTLDAAKAPHTVNLLSFLAADHFYDGSYCHRSTNASALTVLQCGDPSGSGAGSIGFTIAEENLTGATYPRGTLAMAKTSAAHSTGSQFFLVDKNSQLPPQYTVAGHITSGLAVLDKLLAIGNDSSNGQGDGAPKQMIYLEKVTVTKG